MSEASAYLSSAGPDRPGGYWPLPRRGEPVTVGRGEANTVSLPDDVLLSRVHAAIGWENGRWTVADHGSRNGTWVNGRRLAGPWELDDGDVIGIGRTLLKFHASPSTPRAPAAAARPVHLTRVLLIAAAVEVVGLLGTGLVTFLAPSVPKRWQWALSALVAVVVAVGQAAVEQLRGESQEGAAKPAGRSSFLTAALVVVLVFGVGGTAVTAGARYGVGYVTGKEDGVSRLAEPASGRSGALRLTVTDVISTAHFTRVVLTVRNTGSEPATLPLFDNCVLNVAGADTLQADDFRSQWPDSVPAGARQQGTVTFTGHLPAAGGTAALSFSTVFRMGGGSLTVGGLAFAPAG